VATTIGEGLLDSRALTLASLLAALLAAVVWNLVTWYAGLPSSSSHALVGGLIGSAVAGSGWTAVQAAGLAKVMLALVLSPPLGMAAGFLLMRLLLRLMLKATPRVNDSFRRLQVPTLVGLALSHGTNDAQKTMGVITLALLLDHRMAEFRIPLWVVIASAGSMAIGVSLGGWRLIRTLGAKIYRIRPIHAFSSQVAGAAVILGAAIAGGPVSTTQVMSSAILGVGAAERWGKVRWGVLQQMVWAWVLTIPLSAALGAGGYFLLSRLGLG
jgi:PiT family inorganic phosphate transporter